MAHTLSVNTIITGFPYPSLPNHPGKPDCTAIKYTHSLLTKNSLSIESPLGRGKNGHLGLVLMETQFELVRPVPFVLTTNPDRTPTILAWTSPFNDNKILREIKEHCHKYKKCQTMDSALCNQLLTVFGKTYFYPLNHALKGYSTITKLQLIGHLYGHYARISATNLTENEPKLWELYNPDKQLKIIYTSINKCVKYSMAVGKPITEVQLV